MTRGASPPCAMCRTRRESDSRQEAREPTWEAMTDNLGQARDLPLGITIRYVGEDLTMTETRRLSELVFRPDGSADSAYVVLEGFDSEVLVVEVDDIRFMPRVLDVSRPEDLDRIEQSMVAAMMMRRANEPLLADGVGRHPGGGPHGSSALSRRDEHAPPEREAGGGRSAGSAEARRDHGDHRAEDGSRMGCREAVFGAIAASEIQSLTDYNLKQVRVIIAWRDGQRNDDVRIVLRSRPTRERAGRASRERAPMLQATDNQSETAALFTLRS